MSDDRVARFVTSHHVGSEIDIEASFYNEFSINRGEDSRTQRRCYLRAII